MSTPARPASIRFVVPLLLSGIAAAVALLAVGWVFNRIEAAVPSIPAEYQTSECFRPWPGWTERYMFVHPIGFGFVFAAGWGMVRRGRSLDGWNRAAGAGAVYGLLLFAIGSLPVFALVYASFQVSPELVAVSWAGRNLAQYVTAGVCVGLVTRAWDVGNG